MVFSRQSSHFSQQFDPNTWEEGEIVHHKMEEINKLVKSNNRKKYIQHFRTDYTSLPDLSSHSEDLLDMNWFEGSSKKTGRTLRNLMNPLNESESASQKGRSHPPEEGFERENKKNENLFEKKDKVLAKKPGGLLCEENLEDELSHFIEEFEEDIEIKDLEDEEEFKYHQHIGEQAKYGDFTSKNEPESHETTINYMNTEKIDNFTARENLTEREKSLIRVMSEYIDPSKFIPLLDRKRELVCDELMFLPGFDKKYSFVYYYPEGNFEELFNKDENK